MEEVTHMYLFTECVWPVQIPLFLVDVFIVYNSFLKYETERKIHGNCRVNIRMYQHFWRPQYSSTDMHHERLGPATLDCQVGEGWVPYTKGYSTTIAIHL